MAAFVFCKLHRKTPVPQSLFSCNFIKKETLAKLFSCEFYEITKNTFFYRTPLVAASGCISTFVLEKYNLVLGLNTVAVIGYWIDSKLGVGVINLYYTLYFFINILWKKAI